MNINPGLNNRIYPGQNNLTLKKNEPEQQSNPSFKGTSSAASNALIKLGTNGGPIAATMASCLAIGTMRPLLLMSDKNLKKEDKTYSAAWYGAVSAASMGLLALYKKPLEDGIFNLSANLLKNNKIKDAYKNLDTAKKGLNKVTNGSLLNFHNAQTKFNDIAALKGTNGKAVVGLSKFMTFAANMVIMVGVANLITKFIKPVMNKVLAKKEEPKDPKNINNTNSTADDKKDTKIIKNKKDAFLLAGVGTAIGLLALSKIPVVKTKLFDPIKKHLPKINPGGNSEKLGKFPKFLEKIGNKFTETSNSLWTTLEIAVNGVSRFTMLSAVGEKFSAVNTGVGEATNFGLIQMFKPLTSMFQKGALKNNPVHSKLMGATAAQKESIIKSLSKDEIRQYYSGEGLKTGIDMLFTNFLTLGLVAGVANNFVSKKLMKFIKPEKTDNAAAQANNNKELCNELLKNNTAKV